MDIIMHWIPIRIQAIDAMPTALFNDQNDRCGGSPGSVQFLNQVSWLNTTDVKLDRSHAILWDRCLQAALTSSIAA
jgi:hypothetical protein